MLELSYANEAMPDQSGTAGGMPDKRSTTDQRGMPDHRGV